MTNVVAHVSPYRRIEIGARTSVAAPAEAETASAKSLREGAEQAQYIENARIWNHLVQTAQGCNPPGDRLTS